MRNPLSIIALLVVVGLTGCSDTPIPASEIEKSAATLVGNKYRVKIKSVKCPSELEEKQDATIKCTVTGADGSTGRVRARATDDEGGYVVTAQFLDIRREERTISRQLSKRGLGDRVKVDCQEVVPAKRHEVFACKATVAVDTGNVHLTVTRRVRATVIDHTGRFAHVYVVVK